MKKITFFKSLLMVVLLTIGSISILAQTEVTYTFADKGFANAQIITNGSIDANLNYLAEKNSSATAPTYYTSGSALRMYAGSGNGNSYTITTLNGVKITSIEIYALASYTPSVKYNIDGGDDIEATLNGTTYTISGIEASTSLKFRNALASGTTPQLRITGFKVTYITSSTPTVATPTFNPAAGTYTSAQNVTISTTTADASIYYTTNGDEPTESSTPYTAPVSVAVSTTLKAKAYKAGMDPSATATAAYTINPTPTITVTEVDVPAMSSVVPNIDTEIINITGTNLTGEITLTIDAIDGFDATVFGVSTPTLPSTGGVATISFAPGAPGVYAATLKINSAGAAEVTRTLNGTATLKTPEATDATGVSPTGFTANWEIVEGATSYELSVYKKNSGGTTATDLFFSEYLEGSSNNKALEIYNGTGASVDLSQYKVELYSNGSASVGNMLSMTGILNHGEVYVIYNSSANAAIQAVGDVSSTVTYFNGDDAIVLKKGETIIDVIGRVGEDPGTEWTAAGGYSTLDKTLVRKSSVTGGVTVNPESGFPTLATEWDVYSQDYTDNLGSHTMSGAGSSLLPIDGSPFTIISGTEKGITGLLSDTHYFYTVIAKYGSYSSLVSNEIEVVTSRHTGIEQSEILNNIYVLNDKVMFNSAAGEIVEIYNSVGQRVVNTISVDGVNSIKLEAKGVMLVKIGNRVGKVIM